MPSSCTVSSLPGSSPRAARMVGATCSVSTGLVTVCVAKLGLESSMMTLVSSCEKPPCSASFLPLPE